MKREELIAAGIDYDDGVSRFAQKPELYEKYLLKFFKNNNLQDLIRRLEDKNFEEAFPIAHSLKGNAGNLSIRELYLEICRLVEMLRSGDTAGCDDALCRIKVLYERSEQAVLAAEPVTQ